MFKIGGSKNGLNKQELLRTCDELPWPNLTDWLTWPERLNDWLNDWIKWMNDCVTDHLGSSECICTDISHSSYRKMIQNYVTCLCLKWQIWVLWSFSDLYDLVLMISWRFCSHITSYAWLREIWNIWHFGDFRPEND